MMKKVQVRKLRVESLESRQLLAGGGGVRLPPPPPVPHMSVTTLAVPVVDVLPGQTWVIGKDKFAATTRNKGRLAEIDLLPADGSDQLAGNIKRVEVWANLKGGKAKDGPRKDTYETLISTGYPDWQTDVVSLEVSRPLWVSSAGVSVEYLATASQYLNGDTIGIETEQVAFCDLKGNYVDDSFTSYKGVDPVLHTLESKTFGVSEWQTGKFGSALAGQKNVTLLTFSGWWSEGVTPGTVTFTASQGDIANAASYSLAVDYNWDGDVDAYRPGDLKDGKLVFTIPQYPDAQYNNAKYEVWGNIADTLASDPHLQLAFDTAGLTATNTDTGKPLCGVIVNGVGAGQILVYTSASPVFTFRKNPELVVEEIPATTPYGYVDPGIKDVVLNTFMAYGASGMAINHVAITAAVGDLSSFTNYTLWWDSDGNGTVDSSVPGQLQVRIISSGTVTVMSFDTLSVASVANGNLFEVHADARDDIQYGYLRTQLAGDAGIGARLSDGSKLAADKVFEHYADQTQWVIGGGGLG